MRWMFFFTVKNVCSLVKKTSVPSSPFLLGPMYYHALPCQTIFDFLSHRHKGLFNFTSEIMDIFWLAKANKIPISLTTRLAANPDL